MPRPSATSDISRRWCGLSRLAWLCRRACQTDDYEVTDSVITYDPKGENSWKAVAPMPTPRARFRLVAAGDHLYAIGGFSKPPQALPVLERYNPRLDTWDQIAPMHEARGLPGAVAIRTGGSHSIVVVGGGAGEIGTPTFKVLESSEIYNVDTGTWRMLQARLPRGRVSLVCALDDDGSVLAIGGATGDPTPIQVTALVEALDLASAGQ